MLRFAQLGTGFAVAKFAATDIEIGGATIPAGATVFLSLGSANRDEDVFGPDADRFDLARRSAQRQLAFGNGPHFCLGAALARVELQEGIGRLLTRFPGLRFDGNLADVVLASNLFTYYPRALPALA
jgi:cytochrome P450